MAEKLLYVVGGPNGAGKTTVATRFLAAHPIEYIGADKIAAELSPHQPALAQIDAAREFVKRFDECLSAGRSCAIESTLSGKTLRRAVERAQSLGYRVDMQFVFIDSARLSTARVKERVAKGGHDVPDADIQRRFLKTFRNFWELYRPLADYWVLTYNGDRKSVDVAFGTPQSQFVLDDVLFRQFLATVERGHASSE
jgi:predicted ABC-type ATPase